MTVAPELALVDGVNPLRFAGGKSADGVWQRIVNLIPPHRVLIEPFAGEGTIARKIRPAEETILIDRVRQPGLVLPPGARFVLGCGIAFLKTYRWRGDEMIYADPPYLLTTRGGREYYENEADHVRLLRVLKNLNSNVLLSGYRSPLYDRELGEWSQVEFQAMTRGGTVATEVLWFNYPRPVALHDFSVVGEDTRARWRLRKKIRRAVADLASMPGAERGAMFAALVGCLSGEECRAALAAAGAPELARLPAPAPIAENGAGGRPLGSLRRQECERNRGKIALGVQSRGKGIEPDHLAGIHRQNRI